MRRLNINDSNDDNGNGNNYNTIRKKYNIDADGERLDEPRARDSKDLSGSESTSNVCITK